MAGWSESFRNFFEQLEIIFAIRTRYNKFIFIETIFSFDQLCLFNLLLFICLTWNLFIWFFMNIVNESPLLEEIVNPYDSTCISRQTFSCLRWSNVLFLSQINYVVSIFLIKLFMLLKLDIALYKQLITIVASIPFFILNHSGRAFFSIQCTEFRLNHCVLAGMRIYLWLSASLLEM